MPLARLNLSGLAFVFTGFGAAMPARHTIYNISPSPDSALVAEVSQKGWSHRKSLFAFERFSGELWYDAEHPLDTKLSLLIQADSLVYRHSPNARAKSERLRRWALSQARVARDHPELTFQSREFRAKPLRGFVVEGAINFNGLEHTARANIGFGVEKKGRLQVDADAVLRLSDWGLSRPHSLFGLVHTENEIVLHALLWGERPSEPSES